MRETLERASKQESREALKDNTPKQGDGHYMQRLLMVTVQMKSA